MTDESLQPVDHQLLQPIADRVITQAFSHGTETLSDSDLLFLLAWSYAGELDNGGHAQFFFNSTGEYTPETVDARVQLGLREQAQLLRQAAQLLFGSYVPRNLDERNAKLGELPDGGEHDLVLGGLDDRFFELGGGDPVYHALSSRYVGGGAA